MLHQEEIIIVPTAADFRKAAERVLLRGVKKILLYGEMGAGKTTFTRAFCEVLGIETAAQSPTFSLINHYTGGGASVHHADLYRLKTLEEALEIGMEDCLFDSDYCLIEWAQVMEPFLSHYFDAAAILAVQIELLEGTELAEFQKNFKNFDKNATIQPRKVVILQDFLSKKDFF